MRQRIVALLLLVLGAASCALHPGTMPSKMVERITLDSHTCSVCVDETWPLRVSFAPAGSSSVVTWLSSDDAVATVSSIGTVTGISEGKAMILVVSNLNGEASDVCEVTVLPPREPEPDVDPDDPGDDPPVEPDPVLFDSCDNLDYYTQNATHRLGVSVETTDAPQGSGYIRRISGQDPEIFIFGRGTNVVDARVTDPATAQLAFWFYIDDAALLRRTAGAGGRIEISSSGSPSRQALYWDSKEWIAEKVANGWNRIRLPFAQAKEMTPDQPFNAKAANYFRIYFNGAAASTEMIYGIDAIGFLQY